MGGVLKAVDERVVRMHVVVRGRVQGVGFRWFVREVARSLDLAGWVKNREDGGVEVLAEGGEASMSLLMKQLREGPTGAVVRNIEVAPAERMTLSKPFVIGR